MENFTTVLCYISMDYLLMKKEIYMKTTYVQIFNSLTSSRVVSLYNKLYVIETLMFVIGVFILIFSVDVNASTFKPHSFLFWVLYVISLILLVFLFIIPQINENIAPKILALYKTIQVKCGIFDKLIEKYSMPNLIDPKNITIDFLDKIKENVKLVKIIEFERKQLNTKYFNISPQYRIRVERLDTRFTHNHLLGLGYFIERLTGTHEQYTNETVYIHKSYSWLPIDSVQYLSLGDATKEIHKLIQKEKRKGLK